MGPWLTMIDKENFRAVLLALGFTGADASIGQALEVPYERGVPQRRPDFATDAPGVFVAGDAGRGASLIVWAIAEGRAAAAKVDEYLEGSTILPAPVKATDRAITV